MIFNVILQIYGPFASAWMVTDIVVFNNFFPHIRAAPPLLPFSFLFSFFFFHPGEWISRSIGLVGPREIGYLLPVSEHFSRPIQPQYRISDTSRGRYKLRGGTIAPLFLCHRSCFLHRLHRPTRCRRHPDSPLNTASTYLNGHLAASPPDLGTRSAPQSSFARG